LAVLLKKVSKYAYFCIATGQPAAFLTCNSVQNRTDVACLIH